jgi:hypothetical protein
MAYDSDDGDTHHSKEDREEEEEEERGRCVTVRFTGDSEAGGGDLDVWVEEGESVGSVKEKVSLTFLGNAFGANWREDLENGHMDGECCGGKRSTALCLVP